MVGIAGLRGIIVVTLLGWSIFLGFIFLFFILGSLALSNLRSDILLPALTGLIRIGIRNIETARKEVVNVHFRESVLLVDLLRVIFSSILGFRSLFGIIGLALVVFPVSLLDLCGGFAPFESVLEVLPLELLGGLFLSSSHGDKMFQAELQGSNATIWGIDGGLQNRRGGKKEERKKKFGEHLAAENPNRVTALSPPLGPYNSAIIPG